MGATLCKNVACIGRGLFFPQEIRKSEVKKKRTNPSWSLRKSSTASWNSVLCATLPTAFLPSLCLSLPFAPLVLQHGGERDALRLLRKLQQVGDALRHGWLRQLCGWLVGYWRRLVLLAIVGIVRICFVPSIMRDVCLLHSLPEAIVLANPLRGYQLLRPAVPEVALPSVQHNPYTLLAEKALADSGHFEGDLRTSCMPQG